MIISHFKIPDKEFLVSCHLFKILNKFLLISLLLLCLFFCNLYCLSLPVFNLVLTLIYSIFYALFLAFLDQSENVYEMKGIYHQKVHLNKSFQQIYQQTAEFDLTHPRYKEQFETWILTKYILTITQKLPIQCCMQKFKKVCFIYFLT